MASRNATTAAWTAAGIHNVAHLALQYAARGWFAVTVAGQCMFAAYIAVLYGGTALRGEFAAWNRVMTHGHVEGAAAGNVATGLHLFGAAAIMLGGALQLLPGLRARAPALHRWNGRLYLVAAVGASLSGIYMVWWRGAVGDTAQHVATTLNGVLVVLCAGMALLRIRARLIEAHRRWALRLFLAVSGVWFFRIGLMFWLVLNRGPAGFDPRTFEGPFLTFLAFAQAGVPLAVLELYFLCRARGGAAMQFGMACVLASAALATAVGVAAATAGMWLPNM